MPARYPRGRRERGNIFIAPSERSIGGSKTDGGGRGEGAKQEACGGEVELRVIEKPVVHPDRRFISLVHARRCTRASLLLSRPSLPSTLPSSRRRLLSRSRLPHVGIRKTRKRAVVEKGGGANGADARRGKPKREEREREREKKTRGRGRGGKGREKKKIVRNNARGGAFSRDYRRAARRGPP